MTDDIVGPVIDILARQAVREPDEIDLDATLETLGIDSMGLVEIIFAIEETFDVSVPFNANAPEAGGLDLTTARGVIEAVRGLVAARES
ncbi:MAG: acyl carrier protein [Pseudomonadota bacterium]|nr:acyl carrier protein [Pseudomonadota bacterium]